jgi:hypothetical protein
MTSEVRTLGRRSDTFDMMRLCSRVRSRWKRNRAPRTSAAANGGLPAENVEIVDLAADGGVESWSSPAEDEFHPVDPYCVPWSEERPDVYICAPVPEGWTPPPPPGSYADYPAVCDDAAKAFEGQALSLAERYQLRFAPAVDVETCGAAGMLHGSGKSGLA